MYTVVGNIFRISVRNLVEFVYSSGDIDNRSTGVADVKAMQEGARIHRKIQHSMGATYHAEVMLKKSIDFVSEEGIEYKLKLEGRADGIIADIDEDEDGNKRPLGEVTIDEIKTVQTDISKLKAPVYVHKAQAMVYAYIYLNKYKLENINIQMTYCNTETEKIVRFKEVLHKSAVNEWFDNLMADFKKWMDYVFDERRKMCESVEKLKFPFEYRKGQKKLVGSVYKAISEEKTLYVQAPTGVGKTISTIYPSVQACARGMAEKIFYLTSKTITRTVAEETYKILRESGLYFRTVTLTAKDKICHLEERNCNPAACEYAKGHFDRVNDAVYDIIMHEKVINRDKVQEYSKKHKVCPFEMSLDISYWCDGIICDYNYVFDPDACLKRYFADSAKGDYIFLVDEAHNLVDRAREMYSASLIKEDFLKCKNIIKDIDKKLAASLEKCNKYLLELKRKCDDEYIITDDLGTFPQSLMNSYSLMQKFFEKHKNNNISEEVLEFFFKIRHFLNMYDCIDDKYVVYAEHKDNKDFAVNLYCVDPSGNISSRLEQGKAAVLFSATLLPVNYFKEMLSGNIKDAAVYANSPFDTANKRVIIGRDVSSRYTRRNDKEYTKIASYIYQMINSKAGNYMVFFPSYSYMQAVYEVYSTKYSSDIIVQPQNMKEEDKEKFLQLFKSQEEQNVTAFCVLGGIFSEGIDLRGESLIGVAVVGTGIPMICRQRNILRNYFDSRGKNGYQYAYVFPGMNKVLQAAGRVIRTDSDKGIILLLDDRFLTNEYKVQFPREWDVVYPTDIYGAEQCINDFWKVFLL